MWPSLILGFSLVTLIMQALLMVGAWGIASFGGRWTDQLGFCCNILDL